MNDLGPIYVTWTTQTLTVGVYREVDDEPGFTDFRGGNGTVSGRRTGLTRQWRPR